MTRPSHHPPLTHLETRGRRRLGYCLLLTAVFLVVELIGGIWTNSLALISDAGHMFSDVGALAFSMVALTWALKPPTLQKTYGYYRLEILAALINGLLLGILGIVIIYKAYFRLGHPPLVKSEVMLIIAIVGILVNCTCALLLYPAQHKSINLHSAFVHVIADGLGSLAAIGAGLAMYLKGWFWFDPLVSIFIALLILLGSWRLVREASDILMEATPRHIDVAEVQSILERVPGICQVHDLHIWTITSGIYALSMQAVVEDRRNRDAMLRQIKDLLQERFGLQHTTIQLEGESSYHRCSSPVNHRLVESDLETEMLSPLVGSKASQIQS
ncbi:MAG: cation diffusion facilitator family transporter [Desulfobacca sp.]|nr:cation diffusion facilitator family transporter [Desulfobacca sp.]